MKRISFAAAIFLLCICNLHSQDKISVELTGGIISPVKSLNNGLSGTLQFNYHLLPNHYLYVSASSSSWDRNKVIINVPGGRNLTRYSEVGHSLYSYRLGDRFTFFTGKMFNLFADVEAGYSKLSYTSNILSSFTDLDGSINYSTDYRAPENIIEHLFGLGIGAGIVHNINYNFLLQLSVKFNSYVNSYYNGLFGSRNTYFIYNAGIIYQL